MIIQTTCVKQQEPSLLMVTAQKIIEEVDHSPFHVRDCMDP
jgi:hypothetical protein